jgi:uncharacterized protein (TIGR02996 family)
MTDTEAALLRTIAAMPEEDTPRLVYADYLDEQGGQLAVARAEFIRLQVMLARAECKTPETHAAKGRVARLRKRYGQAWGLPKEQAAWCTVRRGFVAELVINGPQIPRDEICALLEREPVGRLIVVRPDELSDGWSFWSTSAADWLNISAFQNVCHLELRGGYWTDREIARLLAFTNFPTLTSLVLHAPPLTAAGVAAIANCERLRGLKSLGINDSQQRHEALMVWSGGVLNLGAQAIATSRYLVALRELSLRSGGIESAGARALADSINLKELTSLNLIENPGIGAVGREALVARFGSAVLF